MNRKIIFRGKSIKNGKWYRGDLRQLAFGETRIVYGGCLSEAVEPNSVGQYTGLKDKNAKEVFEGDIIAHKGKIIGHIVGGVRGYCYDVIYKHPITESSWALYSVITYDYKGDVEVIGNMYDNKDLLL